MNANFHHPSNTEASDKNYQPMSFNLFRNHRNKLLQQQKERFQQKYPRFTSDIKQPKDDSLKLDPLVNPTRLCFSKTRPPDEIKNSIEAERKITGSVNQSRTKKLKSKEKLVQISKNRNSVLDHEDFKRSNTSEVYHGRRSEMVRNHHDLSTGKPAADRIDNELEELKEDNYFPHIMLNEKHEEDACCPTAEVVPHKLPDLTNKYRKFLKESSSDESDNKAKIPFELADPNQESDGRTGSFKDSELEKNDNYDIFSNSVNRSRSMLNRFAQNNNTSDSRVASKNILPNARLMKDDASSASPQRLLNISGSMKKKVSPSESSMLGIFIKSKSLTCFCSTRRR